MSRTGVTSFVADIGYRRDEVQLSFVRSLLLFPSFVTMAVSINKAQIFPRLESPQTRKNGGPTTFHRCTF
jgi:hypothetical protein